MTDAAHSEKRTCAYFVERKRRLCRMAPVSEDHNFCVQHMPISNSSGSSKDAARQRILCPFDSKHSCYQDQLSKHLKRCNFREKAQPAFYERNINSGNSTEDTSKAKAPIGSISDASLLHLMEKLERAYSENVQQPMISMQTCDLVEEELRNNPLYGLSVSKHLKQNSSIIGILKEKGFLENGCCFIEFGAGRGQLSYWLIQAMDLTQESSFVLIDRASQRHKFDNKYKVKDKSKLTRLKIDIEHLNLAKVPQVCNSKNIIAVSKHLCGAATDLALHCLVKYRQSQSVEKSESTSRILGLFFALCCHHRCSWKHYFGKKHLESWGFDEEDFGILQGISSWATCGAKETSEVNAVTNTTDINHRYHFLDLSPQKRMEIGMKSKLLIDEGRARSLRDNGFAAELLLYVGKDVSLENVGLLASSTAEFVPALHHEIP